MQKATIKNDPELKKLTVDALEDLIIDIKEDAVKLSDYWSWQYGQYEFKVYTRDIKKRVEELDSF
jgi:hypothetical protein